MFEFSTARSATDPRQPRSPLPVVRHLRSVLPAFWRRPLDLRLAEGLRPVL